MASNVGSVLLFLVLSAAVLSSFSKHWQVVKANSKDRSDFLRQHIQSYEVAEFLRSHSEYKVVQIGLESDLYYLPPNTIGDHFGPGRYRDLLDRSPAELARKLESFGANTLLLRSVDISKTVTGTDDFFKYFVLVMKTPGAELYALK